MRENKKRATLWVARFLFSLIDIAQTESVIPGGELFGN